MSNRTASKRDPVAFTRTSVAAGRADPGPSARGSRAPQSHRNLTLDLFVDRQTGDDDGRPCVRAGGRSPMRVNRGLMGWGVFFIVLGVVPLAVQAGALDPEVVRRAWQLWPLILIGIGLGLVLARTRLAILGSLVVAVTFGLMGGALIATGVGSAGGFTSCGFGAGQGGEAFPTQTGALRRRCRGAARDELRRGGRRRGGRPRLERRGHVGRGPGSGDRRLRQRARRPGARSERRGPRGRSVALAGDPAEGRAGGHGPVGQRRFGRRSTSPA